MNIRFNPPQLEQTRHSPTLCRLAQEMVPANFEGELRILQNFPDEPTRFVLIQSGRWPASIEVPPDWLDGDLEEDDLRERLEDLLYSFSTPTSVHS